MLDAFLLIVVGLSGDPEHGELFHQWGETLVETSAQLGIPEERVIYLAEDLGAGTLASARSTREAIDIAIDDISAAAGLDDVVYVILFGHGTFDGREAKFNLPGPDLSAGEFDTMLERLAPTPLVFVDTSSASGPFIEALSGPGRTVVTATRNGAEQYVTLFGGYFVEALTSEDADADKNRRVSILEAFQYSRRLVAEAYEREGLLLTEHALLDDNGDGEGSDEPTALEGDGMLAATLSMGSTDANALPVNPQLRALYLERQEMERRIESLRLLRGSMDPARYVGELERLATELALKTREIRTLEGTPIP
jgi:hypothetical protein